MTTMIEDALHDTHRRQRRQTVLARPHASEASDKRQVVHELFTSIAPGYDRFNRLASLGLDQLWRRQAVAAGGLRPGMRVLDVCSGTGDLALFCARALDGQCVVIGLDFTRAMLEGARRKRGAQRVGWLNADALAMPFADATFDRLFIGFSTRNFANLTDGVREMVRVLKPGGQLIVLETGWPSHPLVRGAYWLFLATVVRVVGLLVTGRVWPFTYLARSVRAFVTPAEFTALLQRLGTSVEYRPLSGGLASLYLATKASA